ncbi:MAG: sugar ABC transporter (sugar-binding protein) [Hydrogenibacillus schlegelii]|uniref:Sugar ABC transporter (Sugar-binding protein) n=1 Tax=Hydrogenibacillus schlegelii TaxID=1484 RepID=A0A2T5G9D2_HYDSH|nr:substrate-binding domain-containing protein [Hydrogenibacillus schlegelii]PTQ52780.1 MAG: sugar ABC transporter (sugar-binding protein) [Hydrogenibacillus schlegelii]
MFRAFLGIESTAGRRAAIAMIALLILTLALSAYFGYRAYRLPIDDQPLDTDAYRGQRYHLLLIGQEADNPYWQRILTGARRAAQAADVYLDYRAPSTPDPEAPQKLIEWGTFVRVDGILTPGLDPQRYAPVIDRAVAAGIPVITIDTDAPASRRIAFVGTYNYYAGRQAARELVRLTGGRARIGIITGRLDTSSFAERVQGFLDEIHAYPEMHVLAIEASDLSRLFAAEKASQMLQKYPDLNAFFGTSALDGPGIVDALRRHGRAGRVAVVAFDDLPETVAALHSGTIQAIVVQNPELIGEYSIHLMVKTLSGQPVAPLNLTDTHILRHRQLPRRN